MDRPRLGRAVSEAVLDDPALRDELFDKHPEVRRALEAPQSMPMAGDLGLESVGPAALPEGDGVPFDDMGLEAIIEQFGRPSLLVIGDTFDDPESEEWRDRLLPHRDAIAASIPSVGRVEITFHAEPHGGSGWMVAPNIAITNRHVARIFANHRNGVYPFAANRDGQQYEVAVDFLEEHDRRTAREIRIAEVLYITEDRADEPDLAFLRLEASDGAEIPPAITLSDRSTGPGRLIVNIGYPAHDARQDQDDQDRIFAGIYGKKRLAPGKIKAGSHASLFAHDCTTLGGCSGSVILDLETGEAMGLHFAGRRGVANYAVTAETIGRYLDTFTGAGIGGRLTVGGIDLEASQESPVSADEMADRVGYDPSFLGEGVVVPLPKAQKPDVVLAVDGGGPDNELRYHHYSVVMHQARRLALLTAVNIDGSQMRRVKRGHDRWYFDPRIDEEYQLGNDLYTSNPLDRGHLVRRLDPAWGSERQVDEAVADTFYWTNSAPQHARLNRDTWVSLEDYILDSADTHGFRASVFTGPVFQEDDPWYRDLTQLPQAYWKIAVMLKEDGDDVALSATGYVLSQADLVTDLEFAYGPFKTFQVPLKRLERLATLELADELLDADPLAHQESPVQFRELLDLGDLVL
jgi:endonuclease G